MGLSWYLSLSHLFNLDRLSPKMITVLLTKTKEFSGLLGGALWLASWAVSAFAGLSEGTEYGWAFLVFLLAGVTGPIAGIATGLIWGNWLAFVLGAIGWLLIAIAPDLSEDLNRPLTPSVGGGRCRIFIFDPPASGYQHCS
jgi:hypothetical protein